MSRTVNDILMRIAGTQFSPEEALELIAAVTQRTRGAIPKVEIPDTPDNRAALGIPQQAVTIIDAERYNQRGDYPPVELPDTPNTRAAAAAADILANGMRRVRDAPQA